MAEKYASKDIFEPINVLWMYYFVQGNDEPMERIWKTYLSSRPILAYKYVLQAAREQQSTALVEKLLDLFKSSSLNEKSLGVAYSCLIDIYATQSSYAEGLRVIDRAVSAVGIQNINNTALLRIKNGLERSGKEFPYRIDKEKTIRN